MTRLSVRLTLLIFGLIVGMTLAVRLLAYDDAYFAAVRGALNFSTPCHPEPCFRAIAPGQTSVDEAIAILRADVHVNQLIVSSYVANADEFLRVEWDWRDMPFYEAGSQLELHRRSTSVEWISVPTTLTSGELWLAVGHPRAANVDNILQTLEYDGFYVVSRSACDAFWNAKVEIVIAASGLRRTDAAVAAALWRETCRQTGYE